MNKLVFLLFAVAIAGCGDSATVEGDYAARVDTQVLTEAEVEEALNVLPVGLDSVTARQQIIEQWVQNRLLAEEARRQGLDELPEVERLIEESQRSVLVAALIDQFFERNAEEASDTELEAYFNSNRDQLALREPYLQIRLLSTRDESDAEEARSALQRGQSTSFADSLWTLTANEYSEDPEGAVALSTSYIPQSRLFGLDAQVEQIVRRLSPGGTSEVFESSGHYHVVQLVDRVVAGTPPELRWVRDELKQRLAIENRDAMLVRQIEQLKNEAEAQGRLEIR